MRSISSSRAESSGVEAIMTISLPTMSVGKAWYISPSANSFLSMAEKLQAKSPATFLPRLSDAVLDKIMRSFREVLFIMFKIVGNISL